MNASLDKVKEGYDQFKNEQKSLLISSLTKDGMPHISYAPYVTYEGDYYIYISRTAEHFENLLQEKAIEVMLIKDESLTQTMFARERIRYEALPRIVDENSYEEVFELFEKNHTKALMNMLRTLDFSLFRLKLVNGRYIVGFGQAYDIHVETGELAHVIIEKGMHVGK